MQRGERAAKNVVHAAVSACLFNRENVVGFFDDANRFVIAGWANAIEARIRIRDVVARGALADFLFGIANSVRESHGFFWRGAQEMERKTLRGFLSDTGKMFEGVD